MQIGDRITRRMKLHDLRILMAVAQAGSMNKAAVFLNMTQSAVSRSIAELERTVGVSLLDRTARGAEPTEYGRAMLECGVAVFDDLRHYADMRIMPSRWPFVLVNRPFRPGISA